MNTNNALQSVDEIRKLMERSTKFVSLSGLTGILAGSYALTGAFLAAKLVGTVSGANPLFTFDRLDVDTPRRLCVLVGLAAAVLAASVITAWLVSWYKARKSGEKLFNSLTYRLLWHFFLPMATGGLFCVALLYHGHYGLTSSVMLLFYGLALVNTAKYTFSNVAWLGYAFLITGLADSFWEGHGFFFWTLGFGVFHILYGILFYLRYERKK